MRCRPIVNVYLNVFNSNKLRQTRTAALDTQDADGNENVFLGFEGQDFTFQDLENEVEFIECSAESKDMETIKDWMAAVCY